MIIIITLLVLLAIAFYLIGKQVGGWNDELWFVGSFICVIILIIFSVIFILYPISVRADIYKYNISIKTISDNKGLSEIERAALMNKIIEMNAEMAEYQFYNKKFFFKDFIPDEIDAVKLIGDK